MDSCFLLFFPGGLSKWSGQHSSRELVEEPLEAPPGDVAKEALRASLRSSLRLGRDAEVRCGKSPTCFV